MILPQNYDEINTGQRKKVRDEYIKLQKEKCYFCGADLERPPTSNIRSMKVDESLYPPGFFNNPIHLHHDHNTGMTIGVVHAYCNAVLWEHHGE